MVERNQGREIKDLVDVHIQLGKLAAEQTELAEGLTTVRAALEVLTQNLSPLIAAAQEPFYRDRKFWAGLFAIPILIAGGWAIDKLFIGKPTALSLIHELFGTQPVVQHAIETDGDPLRAGLEKTLATVLTRKDLLTPVVMALMKPALDEELRKRFDVLHANILQLGLNHPDLVRSCGDKNAVQIATAGKSEPANRHCQDTSAALTRSANSIFGLRAYEKVNIDVTIEVREIPRNDDGELVFNELKVPAKLPTFSEILKVTLDGGALDIRGQESWITEREIGSQTMALGRMNAKLSKALTDDSPLHTFTVRLMPGLPDAYVVWVSILVTVPKT